MNFILIMDMVMEELIEILRKKKTNKRYINGKGGPSKSERFDNEEVKE